MIDPDVYCYVLGCYLGDGHVTQRSANGWELRVACDQRYPGIIAEIGRALGGRVAEYSYILHFFSNLSSDIRGIFVEHCRVLGIRVTQSNHRNLSIPHRHSVAMLEQIVGPRT